MTVLDDSYPIGMLVDTDIKRAMHQLFSENESPANAKYSTYEILLDNGYKKVIYNENGQLEKINVTNPDGNVSAAPGETILVYSKESFTIPNNVYARVNTVGQIFLAGFSAENTYIDPGYSGKVGIALVNNSNRTLTINADAPLARVEFIKLFSKPEKLHSGSKGVRPSSVIPSIDHELTKNFENLELTELFKEIKNSITIDALQKKSIRTDVALTRAYISLFEEIKNIKSISEKMRRTHRLLIFILYALAAVVGIHVFKYLGIFDFFYKLISEVLPNNFIYNKLADTISNALGGVVGAGVIHFINTKRKKHGTEE